MSVEYIYTKNYHLFDGLDFRGSIDYNRLLENFSGQLPSCFFRKFTSISELRAKGPVVDADHLLWFLKSLGSVRRLNLDYTGLGQAFFDQLPTSAPLLTNLEVWEHYAKPEVDFNFIAKFSYLRNFDFSQKNLSIKSLMLLVRLNFGKSASGTFKFGSDYHCAIGKNISPTKWCTFRNLDWNSRTEREDPEQVVKWLRKIWKREGSCANRQRRK